MAHASLRLRRWALAAVALSAAYVPGPVSGQAPGSIEGTLEIRQARPRRTASRYPGGRPAARSVQQLPAVVFVEGSVLGVGAGAPSGDPVMAQRDTAFNPGVLVAPVGTAVEFANDDTFFHNVFSYSGPKRFDLGRYPKGESKTMLFDEPGIVNVYCEVHEHMRAAILVVVAVLMYPTWTTPTRTAPRLPGGTMKRPTILGLALLFAATIAACSDDGTPPSPGPYTYTYIGDVTFHAPTRTTPSTSP